MVLASGAQNLDDPITRPDDEFVHCLEGVIEYWVSEQKFTLGASDSLLFDATQPRCWKNINQSPVDVILVFQTAQGDLSARQRHMETYTQNTDDE